MTVSPRASLLPGHRKARRVAECAGPRVAAVRVAAAALAVLIALFPPRPAAAAPTIAVDTERHGDVIDIRATAVLNADVGTAWQVLTDYDRYPEFIPDLRSSRVVARHGPMATVTQEGDVALWRFHFPVDITFEILEKPPGSLESRAVAGSLRALTSRYVLMPANAGTRLEYSGHVDPGFALLGDIERAAIARTVTDQFRALADEIERRGSAVRSNSTDGEK